jgi:hypothetical protein
MDRYMQSMKKEAEKRQAQGQNNKNRRPPNSKIITQQDLQEMLDTIEKLTENGANEAAQELLAQLDEILKNLEPGMAEQGGSPNDSATTEMLNELSHLMQRQQELMDQTQRMQPGNDETLSTRKVTTQGIAAGTWAPMGWQENRATLAASLSNSCGNWARMACSRRQPLVRRANRWVKLNNHSGSRSVNVPLANRAKP